MTCNRTTILLFCATLLCACAEEIPPRSVSQFMDDELLLEAVLVRCTENRSESRYDAECVNAREAVKLLEAKAEAERRVELEAQSERKREALRRTQQAAAEARRRAAGEAKRREELEYYAQFGLPLPADGGSSDAMQGNEPVAVIAAPAPAPVAGTPAAGVVQPAAAGTGTPVADVPAPPPEPPAADLGSIRQELKRRNEEETAAAAQAD